MGNLINFPEISGKIRINKFPKGFQHTAVIEDKKVKVGHLLQSDSSPAALHNLGSDS